MAPLELPLADAWGCVLHEDVRAQADVPGYDTAMAEGWAVRVGAHAENQWLRVIDEVPAGFRASEDLVEGTCIKVWPGSPMPPGADAVIPDTGVEHGPAGVRLPRAEHGSGVLAAGSLARVGEVIAHAGTLITPSVLAECARAGLRAVSVYPRPRVLALTVGTEFVEPGIPTGVGLVADHLSFLALAQAAEAGAVASRIPPALDDVDELIAVIDDQRHRADLIILVGVDVHDFPALCDGLGLAMQGPDPRWAHGTSGATEIVALGPDLPTLADAGRQVIPLVVGRLMGRRPA